MQLGAIKIKFPFWLAPMAGYTDAAFRSVCHEFGGGLFYTEVAVAQGLVRHSKPSWHLLETFDHEGPMVGHIYGSDPDVMAETAAMIEQTGRFVAIDINAGCPVRKIVAKGAGAALIRNPDHIGTIVQRVREAVSLPVMVKTRIGYLKDQPRIQEIARAVEDAGASALAIHGRYATQQHRGPVDWECIHQIKQQCSLPIIGNGGLFTAEEAVNMLRHYALDGVMIARGAVGNPWIFEDAERILKGLPPKTRDLEALREVMRLHLERLVALKQIEAGCRRRRDFDADRGAALHFRCHLVKYFSHLRNWNDIRRSLNAITSTDDVLKAIDTVIARQSNATSLQQ